MRQMTPQHSPSCLYVCTLVHPAKVTGQNKMPLGRRDTHAVPSKVVLNMERGDLAVINLVLDLKIFRSKMLYNGDAYL